jgi:hypothetical protein
MVEFKNNDLHLIGSEFGEIFVRLDENTVIGSLTATVYFNHNGCFYQGSSSLQGTFNPNNGYVLPTINSYSIITCF